MKRDTRIDVVKTIAIFGVLLIHICSYGFPIASAPWLGSVFWRTLIGAAVPLFLMCSGALLLDTEKPLTYKKLYFKSILRILVAGYFWAFMYKLYGLYAVGDFSAASLWTAVRGTLQFWHEFHLYYIQIIVFVYALLPLTRLVAKHAKRRDLVYALFVWFVLGILQPTLSDVWPMVGGVGNLWWMNMMYASVGYTLLGFYLKKYPLPLWAGIVLAVVGFGINFGGTVAESIYRGVLSERFLEGMSVGVCLSGTGIFTMCMHLKRVPRACVYISKASFCIYLMHMLCIYYVLGKLEWSVYSFTPIASAPLLALFVLVFSTAVYFVLSKIPIVNKWLI